MRVLITFYGSKFLFSSNYWKQIIMTTIELMKPDRILNEPKRSTLFVVEFPQEFGIYPWVVQSVTKPRREGKRWENIDIRLIDIIGPSTSQRIMDMIQTCEQRQSFLQRLLGESLFYMSINILDPTGVEIERWNISVKEIVSVDFGELTYGSKDVQTIKLELKPGDCVLASQDFE